MNTLVSACNPMEVVAPIATEQPEISVLPGEQRFMPPALARSIGRVVREMVTPPGGNGNQNGAITAFQSAP